MTERRGTSYIFTSKELAVLLSAAGGNRLAGFSLQDAGQMDKSELVQKLHALFKKGILRQKENGEGLEILPELRPVISSCVHAKRILRMERLYPERVSFAVCYPADGGWTVMRPCKEMPSGWLLEWMEPEAVLELLKDHELLPPADDELQRVQERLVAYAGQEPEDQATPLLFLEWIDGSNGKQVAATRILRGVLTDWMLTADGKQAYMEQRLVDWMKRFAGGAII